MLAGLFAINAFASRCLQQLGAAHELRACLSLVVSMLFLGGPAAEALVLASVAARRLGAKCMQGFCTEHACCLLWASHWSTLLSRMWQRADAGGKVVERCSIPGASRTVPKVAHPRLACVPCFRRVAAVWVCNLGMLLSARLAAGFRFSHLGLDALDNHRYAE